MMNTIMSFVADYSFICGIIGVTPVALFAMGMVDELFAKSSSNTSDRKISSYWTTE